MNRLPAAIIATVAGIAVFVLLILAWGWFFHLCCDQGAG